MAVRIRMKMMGRKHRPFFRICAVDSRQPRDGRVLEELGTYDPLLGDTDARARLKAERIAYWLGVGAQPSQTVRTLIKKYGAEGTHVDKQRAALEQMAAPKVVPDAGQPAYVPPAKDAEPAAAPAPEKQPADAAASQSAKAPAAEGGESADGGDKSESSEQPASVSE